MRTFLLILFLLPNPASKGQGIVHQLKQRKRLYEIEQTEINRKTD